MVVLHLLFENSNEIATFWIQNNKLFYRQFHTMAINSYTATINATVTNNTTAIHNT